MTKTQKRLALAVSVFVFIASGLAACIWLAGYDSRCGGHTAKPAVLIGAEAIGPACARRAGLIQAAKKSGKSSRVQLFSRSSAPREDSRTRDLFEAIEQ